MKVLVADDELVSRKKMERLLQDLGYETRVASPDVYDALVPIARTRNPLHMIGLAISLSKAEAHISIRWWSMPF